MFEQQRERLLGSLHAPHESYHGAPIFRGPSLYFHQRALDAGKVGDCIRFLVPPVDREYTLKFLFRRKDIKNDINGEWEKLRTILRDFFYPVSQSDAFKPKAAEWMQQIQVFKWDTSPLKIVDNLLIGFSKHPSNAEFS